MLRITVLWARLLTSRLCSRRYDCAYNSIFAIKHKSIILESLIYGKMQFFRFHNEPQVTRSTCFLFFKHNNNSNSILKSFKEYFYSFEIIFCLFCITMQTKSWKFISAYTNKNNKEMRTRIRNEWKCHWDFSSIQLNVM